MYLIGIFCIALTKKKEETDQYSYYEKLLAIAPNAGNLDNLIEQVKVTDNFEYTFPKDQLALNTTTGVIGNTNLYLGDVVGGISWNRYNIFKGPRGLSRNDDPSQLGEKTRPESFPAKRWEKLISLLKMYSTIGKKSAATQGETVTYVVSYPLAKQIVQFFLDNITPATPCHQTLVSDWVLVDQAKKKYKCCVDLKNVEKYHKIAISTESRDKIFADLLFECKDSSALVNDVYFTIIKVDRSTGKIFAIKRSGEPPSENLSQQFEPLFATY